MIMLSRRPLTGPLLVRDGRDVLAIGFNDLVKYHGRSSIGGVALAYRLMRSAFAVLSPHEPVERRAVSILTAFPGAGAADSFEMVTRCRSDHRFQVDTALPVHEAAAAPTGRYFFQFFTTSGAVALGVREGVVPQEFIELVRRNNLQPLDADDLARLDELKLVIAGQALSLGDDELFLPLPPVV